MEKRYTKLLMERKAKRKRIIKRILLGLVLFLSMIILSGVGYAVYIINTNAEDIDTANIYALVNQKSTLYDDNGKEIEDIYAGDGNREIISYKDLPSDMVNAVVSIEDQKFWTHHGFNFIRMAGAVKEKIVGGGQISGVSTITQQLARNVYLADTKSERTIQRKILEGWYTIQIERTLSKKQIMEAYLNTVYFGFNSYGIESASQTYFSKPALELTTEECVTLAALPQSPDVYALVKYNESGDTEYNGDVSQPRRNLVAKQMKINGYINKLTYDEIINGSIEDNINVLEEKKTDSGYYTDYALKIVAEDLSRELGISKDNAYQMIYTKGLKIYTCLNQKTQNILHEEINNSENYTSISYIPTDSSGNLLNTKDKSILARPVASYLDEDDYFVLKKNEYKENSDGSITIFKNKRLALYETTTSSGKGVEIFFRTLFEESSGSINLIEESPLQISAEYTTFDDENNAVISAEFFAANPNFFIKVDDGLKTKNFLLGQKTPQPQAAAAIIENDTGMLKAMIGGRGTSGKQLLNRADSPRQPGSSIKPISVYAPALQLSADAAYDGTEISEDFDNGYFSGGYITPATIFRDSQTNVGGKVWPKNANGYYSGNMTVRKALQQSCNVVAYKIFCQVGIDESVDFLKQNGITTLDEEGSTNDLNPAALALGGLSNGIKPVEMAAAYSTFTNSGIYKKPVVYTKIINSKGEVLLDTSSEEAYKGNQIYDEGVAFIMTDMLQSVVARGIGGNASIGSIPVGGKTGTTTDQYDIWFSGFSPEYSMALWEGCDVNLKLTSSSFAAASFWSNIMKRICKDTGKKFKSMPSDVIERGEYYIKGTEYTKGVEIITKKATEIPEETHIEENITEETYDNMGTQADPEL